MKIYRYGMRLRPFDIGCQPSGVYKRFDSDKYHDEITYERKLTNDEIEKYSLDYLGEEEA